MRISSTKKVGAVIFLLGVLGAFAFQNCAGGIDGGEGLVSSTGRKLRVNFFQITRLSNSSAGVFSNTPSCDPFVTVGTRWNIDDHAKKRSDSCLIEQANVLFDKWVQDWSSQPVGSCQIEKLKYDTLIADMQLLYDQVRARFERSESGPSQDYYFNLRETAVTNMYQERTRTCSSSSDSTMQVRLVRIYDISAYYSEYSLELQGYLPYEIDRAELLCGGTSRINSLRRSWSGSYPLTSLWVSVPLSYAGTQDCRIALHYKVTTSTSTVTEFSPQFDLPPEGTLLDVQSLRLTPEADDTYVYIQATGSFVGSPLITSSCGQVFKAMGFTRGDNLVSTYFNMYMYKSEAAGRLCTFSFRMGNLEQVKTLEIGEANDPVITSATWIGTSTHLQDHQSIRLNGVRLDKLSQVTALCQGRTYDIGFGVFDATPTSARIELHHSLLTEDANCNILGAMYTGREGTVNIDPVHFFIPRLDPGVGPQPSPEPSPDPSPAGSTKLYVRMAELAGKDVDQAMSGPVGLNAWQWSYYWNLIYNRDDLPAPEGYGIENPAADISLGDWCSAVNKPVDGFPAVNCSADAP